MVFTHGTCFSTSGYQHPPGLDGSLAWGTFGDLLITGNDEPLTAVELPSLGESGLR